MAFKDIHPMTFKDIQPGYQGLSNFGHCLSLQNIIHRAP